MCEHPDSSAKAVHRALVLLAFKVTKENNSKEVNTEPGRETVERVRPEIPVFCHKEDSWRGIIDKRSEVTSGGRQLVVHLQDTTN